MAAVNKTYIYKAYQDSAYVGNLPNVVSEFGYDQEINSAGAAIAIECGINLNDAGAELSKQYLITQGGDYIVTENNERIILAQDYVFTAPIDLNTRIDVWAYYEQQPNGIRVFSGLVESLTADDKNGSIILNVVSFGVQLDNYMITSGDSAFFSQLDATAGYNAQIEASASAKFNNEDLIVQTFSVASNGYISGVGIFVDVSDGGTIAISLKNRAGATPNIDTDTLLATGTVTIPPTFTNQEYVVQFSTPYLASNTANYFLEIRAVTLGRNTAIFINIDNPYAGGSLTAVSLNFAAFGDYDYHYTSLPTSDLTFKLYEPTGSLTAEYTSVGPSTILRDIIDAYTLFGGVVGYSDTSIRDSDTAVNYTFKFNTLMEGIKKCRELAPPNWYYWVDVANSILYFDTLGSEADHILHKGLCLENIVLKYTLEDIKNLGFFSGGDTGGGVNLLRKTEDSVSRGRYGQWLDKINDNRVILNGTADTLNQSNLQEKRDPRWQTTVRVPASKYDIETFYLGQLVAFRNNNNLTDSLLLQIVGIKRRPDIVTLKLDTLPPTTDHRIEDIRRNLEKVITVDNPSTY